MIEEPGVMVHDLHDAGVYGIALEGGVLRMWRDDPEFAQRYSAAIGHDGFEGQWQLARTPGDWHEDLRVVHRRAR